MVALSREKSRQGVKIQMTERKILTVVYIYFLLISLSFSPKNPQNEEKERYQINGKAEKERMLAARRSR
jgi:hypothetical protein